LLIEVVDIFASDNRTLSQKDVAVLVDHFKKGRFAVLPTETGPMLACDALNINAIKMLFELKGRDSSNPVHVALPNVTKIDEYVFVNGSARRLFEFLLPGPITIICPKKDTISDVLVANTGNLGIRIPDSPITLSVCAAAGVPLTATSLNLSGRSGRETVQATLSEMNWNGQHIFYNVVDDAQKLGTQPSTVVRISAEFEAEILRKGPITEEAIENAMRQLSTDDISDWG